MEGTDFRRVDGKTQTHRLGRSGTVRSGRTPSLRQDERLHGRSRPAVSQRSHRLVVLGLVGGQPRRRPSSFRRRGHAGGGRQVPRRHRVPGAHHDEANLAATGRGTGLLRSHVSRLGLASGRAVPSLAQGGLDRLARSRANLRALRGNRGASRHDHHGDRMARPPWLGRPAHTRHRHDLRRRRERARGRARRRGLVAHHSRPADVPLHRCLERDGAKGDGSPSGTWDGSTTTTTCIWATGSRT